MVFCRSDCGGEVVGGGGGMVACLVIPALTSGQFQQPHLQSVFSDFLLCFFLQLHELTTDLGTKTNTQEVPSDQPGPLPSVSNCKYSVVVQLN